MKKLIVMAPASRRVKAFGASEAIIALAEFAGIRVFATGGIGGVHRGAAQTMDVSADLTELGVTPVAVVSAGVKSILDIALTRALGGGFNASLSKDKAGT